MNSFRGGMQVHAVPESERAFDAAGRQLPWGYDLFSKMRLFWTDMIFDADEEPASGDTHGQRRYVEEKGPFGRSTRRRGLSRSKTTGTPARKEDQARAENLKAIDDIFNKVKASAPKAQEQPPAAQPQPPQQSTSAPALPTTQTSVAKEPTEVILYGFSSETQWAAIDFYERVSEGIVYEDYDRHPPSSKYNLSLSINRTAAARSLSAAALRKKNTYSGGNHWIKVTFDSPEAADRACHYSPHTIHGHAVFAELYRGTGPARDIAIPASHAGLDSLQTSPSNSTTLRGSGASPTHSDTASSATATASGPTLRMRPSARHQAQSAPAAVATTATPQTSFSSTATATLTAQTPGAAPADPAPVAPPPLRIRGAKRAVLLPAEQALLPVGNKWQQLLGSLPIINLFVGGGTEVIGSEVPRTDDGNFDWANASTYWRFWALIDSWLGTDFLSIGGDD
ncbi:hypothetical protein GTA08_BOTSDO07534 [Neofusicoccum parvum]|nr:hypothetical protein GTA08_BOTSDO07534 [Neofusicoccum parvum]